MTVSGRDLTPTKSVQPEVTSAREKEQAPAPLLAPHEPPPYQIENREGRAPLLFTCDHASWAVPECLRNLGLQPRDLQQHIGWDPGAAQATIRLARRFDAPAIMTQYSRLVIDYNRAPRTAASIPEVSDHTRIPGNTGLSPSEVARREDALFKPYHAAITDLLDNIRESGATPIYIAVHTFTPSMNGFPRPWHFGVLWDDDSRLAEPLMAQLRRNPGIIVGDNEPYSAKGKFDYSRMRHASAGGLPYALVEIREDLLSKPFRIPYFSNLLGNALERALEEARCDWRAP